MEIIIARHAGFCEGVERAYRCAMDAALSGKAIYMLGDIVHNSEVVAKFKRSGIKNIKNLREIPQGESSALIISAHGVPPEIFKKAKQKNIKIIDTTCPWVKKAQKVAERLKNEGRQVIILGDEHHPEVEGLKGWAGRDSVAVQGPDDFRNARINKRIGFIAQTTQSEEKFKETAAALKNISKDTHIENTICGATTKRQTAAVEVAQKVDLMIVVGDQKSANTKRLTELCAKTGTHTVQVERAAEINRKMIENKKRVGITAGASTPNWIINEVLKLLRKAGDK